MSTSERIAGHLPRLRRFARAVTGSQKSGDAYVAATLEAILADPGLVRGPDIRVSLYRTLLHVINSIELNSRQESQGAAEHRLQVLTPRARQAFLLTSVEELSSNEAAEVLDVSPATLADLIEEAGRDIAQQIATDVLIIEDEPLIAMDLKQIVSELGHRVPLIARTKTQAMEAMQRCEPGLILADIQLADGSSGLDAISEILQTRGLPVVFITAFPERLLTGTRPEPTFLITKPFQPAVVKAVVSQALFFDVRSKATATCAG